jgi:hypothetical protein
LKENNFSPRVFYSAKLSFKIDGGIKVFHNKQKHKTLKGMLHTEDENKCNHERVGSINLMGRADKHSNSSNDSAAHTQILKQQKQLNCRNNHIPLNANTEC